MLPREFYQREPLVCARELIGCTLTWGETAGRIVETEVYAEHGDEACHTFLRKSTRQFIADNEPGAAYVYQNYGIHWLFNVLVKSPQGAGFVLVRALEPTIGLEKMRARRGLDPLRSLCSGPGKLTVALGIGRNDHGFDLCSDPARTLVASPVSAEITTDYRVGISRAADFRWRFLEKDSPFVSVRNVRLKET